MPEGSLTGTQTATKNYAVFNEFETMDTQASRVGIEPTRLAWCENLQILNRHELACVPGPSSAFATPGGSTVKMWYGFVAGVDAVIMFRADGSMVAVTSAAAVITLAGPGTFSNPDVVVWNHAIILVADPTAGYVAFSFSPSAPGVPVFSRGGTVSPNIKVTNGGTGYVTPPAVTIGGGSGGGATAVATVAAGTVTNVYLTNPGSGYLASDVLTVTFGGPGAGATATAKVWPIFIGYAPYTLAIFAGRVWHTDGTQLNWTGTGGYDDVSAADAAGFTQIADYDLVHKITALRSLNNFLWIFGDESIKQIGAISVSGAITNFTIVTLSSDVGTTFMQTILSYNRLVLFANNVGVWAVLGSSVQKVSNEMDGIFALIDFSQQLSAALSDIASRRVYCLLVRYIDPLQSRTRSLLLTYQAGQWYVCSQGDSLTAVTTAFVQSVAGSVETWGSSGPDLTWLLSAPSTSVGIILRTALTHHNKPNMGKKLLRAAVMQQAGNSAVMTFTLDTENGFDSQNYTVATSGVQSFDWQRTKANGTGVYVGMSLSGSFHGWRFNAGLIEYQEGTALASKVGV
jgi:hypothetical protein